MEKKKETPQDRWQKKHARVIAVKLFTTKDQEVLEWWDAQPRKADAFRRMVRQQMQTEEAVHWLKENPEKN